jgi:lipopolysaccharide/colanic/teichoic acid biosynthesis glycosyltransferase
MERITLSRHTTEEQASLLMSETSFHKHTNEPIIVHLRPGTAMAQRSRLVYGASKRALDILLSLFGLLALVPVFLVIAVCIKLDDRGPVFHLREVLGKNGKRFYALKFRTMVHDADAYLAKNPQLLKEYLKNMKLVNDPRVTRFGKFLRKTSLDELPQLANVLIGQMSLVGPRMIHPSELPRYGEFAQKRLSVKPGITGLWQVSSRQHISYDERIALDMKYIDNRALLLDLAILVKTLKVFVIHTGT